MPDIQIPQIDLRVVLQLLIVCAWAVGLLVVDLFVPAGRKRITGYLAILGTLVAAFAGIPLWGSSGSTFNGTIALDTFGLALNWIFLLTSALAIVIALDYLPRQGIERGEFYVLVLFATAGMMLLGQGSDLIVLFLGLELLSITLYVLAGFAYPRLSSEEAAMKYLLTGAFATGFLVFGIALVYGATGSTVLAEISAALQRQPLAAENYAYLLAGTALVVVGFGYKVSLVPFHMWTPDVYQGAPTPVTAFMSVGSKAAAFAGLLRFLLTAVETQRDIWAPGVGALAAATLIVGNIAALTQRNVKRMLAYSSVGQAGYILLGVLAGSANGVQATLFYLLAYALTNLAAFAVLVALEQRGEEAWDMADLAGLWGRRPLLAVPMALAMFSLAGVPPTAGFWAKWYVFLAAWQVGLEPLVLVGVVVSAIGAFYYLRVVAQMFMSAPARPVTTTTDRALAVGVGLAAAAILLLGVVPSPVIDLVQRSVLAAAP
ncbi:MAG TPA: NADH-quinone oxidoreductase subunit N [Roseiflexaceae bacterium]|nr:NADH-quinone oxidoreductase subunit N [Roseiflexaceae bacterium]